MSYGTVPLTHASAGVRRIVGLAYLLVWAWSEHLLASRLRKQAPADRLVLLFDEVEAHLHPRWQRSILPALLQVGTGLQAQVALQVLAATHSPLVLASVEPLFDKDRDRLFRFDLDGQAVRFQEYPWAKQGDVDSWLTSDIFGLKQARSAEAEAAVEAAKAFMSGQRDQLPPGLRTQEEIHQALLRLLPGLDPFWPRWIVQVKNDALPAGR
jgi:hypothetical protein